MSAPPDICPAPTRSVYFNNTKIGNSDWIECRDCGHLFRVTTFFGTSRRARRCKCCRKPSRKS